MPTKFITIFVTASSKKEAEDIVSALVRKRLVSCGNILGGVDSIFIWKKKTNKAKEILIILKTKTSLFKKVVSEIRKIHSYEVPEIIAVPIIKGSREYLKWIDEVTNTQINTD